MSVITITPIALVAGTFTPDLVGADADDVAVATTDTWRVALPAVPGVRDDHLLFVIEEQGGGAAVLIIDAGDNPPSSLATKGSKSASFATSDLKLGVIEAGRHLKSTGYIGGSVTGNNIFMTVYYLPRGS